jgi:ABC-2 type transport system ATP-binding protein
VAAVDVDLLTVHGLPGERISGLLTGAELPFSELRQHRASLEEAYMELTRDAVEFGVPTVEGGGAA